MSITVGGPSSGPMSDRREDWPEAAHLHSRQGRGRVVQRPTEPHSLLRQYREGICHPSAANYRWGGFSSVTMLLVAARA